MADIYVKAGGGNSSPFASWANSALVVSSASGIDAAGDRIFLSSTHSESSASSSNAWAGTAGNPVIIASVNDGAAPPTAVAAGASLTVTGTTFAWSGYAYTKGVTFTFTSATSFSPMFNGTSVSAVQVLEDCGFFYTGAASSSALGFGTTAAGAGSETILRNPSFKLGAAGQVIQPGRSLEIMGGGFVSGGTSPTGVFQLGANNRPSRLMVNGFDLSVLSATFDLVKTIQEGSASAVFRDCKLPSGWSGNLVASGQMKQGTRVEMWNCDAGSTNYRLWVETFQGSIKTSAVVYKDAFTGGTPHSLVMATNTSAAYPSGLLVTPEIPASTATTGSSVTATVEIVTDGVTLTDAECWLEVMFMGASGSPLGYWVSDAKADVLASASNQASGSESWTTAGLSSPVTQKLSVTFTPQIAGYVIGRVVLAKPSTTVYVDPELTLT